MSRLEHLSIFKSLLAASRIAGKICGTMFGGNHVEHVDNNHSEPYLQD